MNNSQVKQELHFVLKEVQRLGVMVKAGEAKKAFAEAGIGSGLKGACGTYLCSAEAQRRFASMIEKLVSEDPKLRARIEDSVYRRTFEREFVVRCIEGSDVLAAPLIDSFIESARTAAVATLQTRQYFFPAHSIAEDGVDEYHVGPTLFVRTKIFFEQHKIEWMSSRAGELRQVIGQFDGANKQIEGSTWTDRYLEAEEYLRDYGWIASTVISGADLATGRRRAHDVIELSCSLLRLFASRSDSSFIGIATLTAARREEHFVSLGEDRTFGVGSASRYLDAIAKSGSIAFIIENEGYFHLQRTVQKYAAWGELTPAELRVLAGLRWFGEAWKEPHSASRVVKFCTCVEGLLSTSDKEGLTEILAERLSVLCNSEPKDIREAYDETKEVYSSRSKIVHGDPNAAFEAPEMARRAETLARLAVLGLAPLVWSFPTTPDKFKNALREFFVTMKLVGFSQALKDLQSLSAPDGEKLSGGTA